MGNKIVDINVIKEVLELRDVPNRENIQKKDTPYIGTIYLEDISLHVDVYIKLNGKKAIIRLRAFEYDFSEEMNSQFKHTLWDYYNHNRELVISRNRNDVATLYGSELITNIYREDALRLMISLKKTIIDNHCTKYKNLKGCPCKTCVHSLIKEDRGNFKLFGMSKSEVERTFDNDKIQSYIKRGKYVKPLNI